MVDMRDLKSLGQQCSCGFDSHPRYKNEKLLTEDGLAPLKETLALGISYPNELHDPK